MAVEIGALRALLSLDSSAFERGARRAEASMSRMQQRLRRVSRGMRDFGRSMSLRVTAPIVGAVGLAVRSSLQLIDTQAKMAESLETSVGSIQNLGRAAELAGVSQGDLEGSLRRMTRRISLAEQGSGPAAEALERLGLSAENLNNIPADERVSAITTAIRDLIPEAQQAGVASQVFGDQTGLAILRLNPDVIAQAADEIDRFGARISDVDADQIEAANDAISGIGLAVRGIGNQLAVALAPVLERVADRIADLAAWFQSISPEMRRFTGIAVAVAAAIGPVAIALGFMAAGLAALASPVGLAVLALGALAGVAVTVAANWEWFQDEFPGIAGVIQGVGETISGVFTGLRDTFAGVVSALEAIINGEWSELWAAAGQIFEGLFTTIDALFGGLPGRIRDWITTGTAQIGETLRQFGRDVVTWIIEGITSGVQRVRDAVVNLFTSDTIAERVREQTTQLGEDIGSGIGPGIMSMQPSAEADIRDFMNGLEDAARDETGTQSPSRVWMDLGRDLMDGLGIGIADRAVAAGQAAADAAAQATMAAGDGIAEAMDAATSRADQFGQRFSSFVQPILRGTQSIGDAFEALGERMLNNQIDKLLSGVGSSLFGGLFGGGGGGLFGGSGFLGLFDSGGTIGAGQHAIVGERRPEIVTGPARVIGGAETSRMMQNGGGRGQNQPTRIELVLSPDLEGRILQQSANQAVEISMSVSSEVATAQKKNLGNSINTQRSRGTS